MSALGQALTFVLQWEGSYVNHPADPGGATMKGITQRVYDEYRTGGRLGTRAVKLISNDEVRDIYQQKYWNTGNCHRLPSRLDLAQFDTAVTWVSIEQPESFRKPQAVLWMVGSVRQLWR